jgi:formylglycine-generating enzyme required for sulfatase activity
VHLNGGLGLVDVGASPDAGTVYETGWDALWSSSTKVAPSTVNLTSKCNDPTGATWTATAGSNETLPVNCVNWYEAYAFCIWDGGFLPSEAEWEYAAAGGSQEREYPWGSTAPGTSCPGAGCQYAIYGCYYPSGSGSCSGVTNIAPVGTATLGGGLWGQLDLGGEMFEWNLDWSNSYIDPCTDCAYLSLAADRALRGGEFYSAALYLLSSHRYQATPTDRLYGGGFRCARTP